MRVLTPSSTKSSPPSINTTPRWVCKDLLLTQGYYKGNAKLWIPKSNPLQTIVSRSTNPCNKCKTVLQAPLPSPIIGHLRPLDTPSTSFEIGKSSKASTTNPLDNYSMVHALAIALPTPTLKPPPPTMTPIAPQLSLVTSMLRHVQTSKGWLSKLS